MSLNPDPYILILTGAGLLIALVAWLPLALRRLPPVPADRLHRPGRGHLLIAEELASGRLVRILLEYEVRPTEMFSAYPAVKFMRPAVRAFAEFVIERLQRIEGVEAS